MRLPSSCARWRGAASTRQASGYDSISAGGGEGIDGITRILQQWRRLGSKFKHGRTCSMSGTAASCLLFCEVVPLLRNAMRKFVGKNGPRSPASPRERSAAHSTGTGSCTPQHNGANGTGSGRQYCGRKQLWCRTGAACPFLPCTTCGIVAAAAARGSGKQAVDRSVRSD